MAVADDLEALSATLRDAYRLAWEDIEAEQQRIADDPARFTRRARLRELQRAVDERLDQVDEAARAWLADEFPQAYRTGADLAADSLEQTFRWTAIDTEAVTLLAQDTFSELLAATEGVSASTKALVRTLGREQALLKAAAGKTSTQAARQLRQLMESKGIHALRYKDGSKHGLGEYTDMLLRTKTAIASNAGTLNFARRAGTLYVECFDGIDCGLTTHNDPEKANGMILTVERAAQFAIAHPRCRRTYGPRPDVQTPEEAGTAAPSTTPEQQADQAAVEVARATDQRTRQNTRRRQEATRARLAAQRAARQA